VNPPHGRLRRMNSTVDPEVALLVSIATTLKPDYENKDKADLWAGSPFVWIVPLAPSVKGQNRRTGWSQDGAQQRA